MLLKSSIKFIATFHFDWNRFDKNDNHAIVSQISNEMNLLEKKTFHDEKFLHFVTRNRSNQFTL